MKCLNTIVFFENREEVEHYISEVAAISNGLVDIALIVNSDTKSQVIEMEQRLRENSINCFQVINYGDNIGYLNTMLKTIRLVNLDKYDYIILSNTDIHYESKDFFQELAKKKYSNDIGCIAPSVFATQSNSFSNPHYLTRIPKKKLERLIKTFKHPLVGKWYLKLAGIKASKKKAVKKPSCFVYSPHGCYMIFTKDFIKKIQGYEYGAKMYSEESVIGELLNQYGFKCFYDDSLSIVHQESSVTGKINYKKRFNAWRDSLEYVLKEFY